MPELNGFPVARQKTDNSCWAAAGRSINNWYKLQRKSGKNPMYITDGEFVDACSAAGKNSYSVDVQASAVAALEDLGYETPADERPFPEKNEIKEEIKEGKPLLAIVGADNPEGKRNLEYKGGHWVVIVGISNDGSSIKVFDPAKGATEWIDYDLIVYETIDGEPIYW